MAVVGALALTSAFPATFTAAGGFWAALAGAGITAGAGLLDSKFIMPELLGGNNNPEVSKPPRFLQLPTMTLSPGSPRVWAYGTRLRVPAHMMFMSEKERIERTASGASKGGQQASFNVRKVFSDVGLALNDRPISRVIGLIGDGRLFFYTDRNLLKIRTSGMSASVVNTNFLKITMASANEIDLSNTFAGRVRYPQGTATATVSTYTTSGARGTLTASGSPNWTTNQWVNKVVVITSGPREGERASIVSNTSNALVVQYLNSVGFARVGFVNNPQNADEFLIADAGDVVQLEGFDASSVNGVYQILYAKPHGIASSSFVLLEPVLKTDGTAITVSVSTAGTFSTPASIARYDNGIAGRRRYFQAIWYNGTRRALATARGENGYEPDNAAKQPTPALAVGMAVTVYTGAGAYAGSIDAFGIVTLTATSNAYGIAFSSAMPSFAQNDVVLVRPQSSINSPPNLFVGSPELFVGTQTSKSSTFQQHLSADVIPDFRGISYIVFDDFNLTEFGNRFPTVESILEVDTNANWQEAFATVGDRIGLTASMRNLSKIARDPFDGYYLRGAVPGVTALQPLMVAKEVVTQDRDGVLHFFPISQCEVVSIRNGSDYSDFGAATESAKANSKFSVAQVERTVLPSSVGVKHQDPDNLFAEGYQHFGVRGPTSVTHKNQSEVDLSNLVLTRQAARNLAGSILRRTWINSTTYELELPASYWHLLENDVLSWTDDDGIVHACRIIKIDRGLNWVLKITAVAEDIAGGYVGSAVQDNQPREISVTDGIVGVDPIVLDIPAVFDIQTNGPGLYLAVASRGEYFDGCTVYESVDAGVSYSPIGTLDRPITNGSTVDALDAYTGQSWTAGSASVTWDNTSTVQVQLTSGTLSTVTQAQVLGGENWALIGNEIVGFTDATLDSPGTYTLSGFLRNLRDQVAEPDIDADQHVVGERFVLLTRFEANGKFRTYPGPANVGQALRFKFVAPGQNIVDVDHVAVTLKARNALPFAPYASTLTWEPNDDATITMTPWTNRNVAIGSTGPYTFDDTVEEYVVRIYTDNTYATETASSPLTVTTRATGAARLRDRWVTYPKASVIADGFTPGSSTIYYSIEQVGDYGASRRKRFQG